MLMHACAPVRVGLVSEGVCMGDRAACACTRTRAGGEERGVGDEEAGRVPALAGLVHHGGLGRGAHARGAHLVSGEHRHAVLLHACAAPRPTLLHQRQLQPGAPCMGTPAYTQGSCPQSSAMYLASCHCAMVYVPVHHATRTVVFRGGTNDAHARQAG